MNSLTDHGCGVLCNRRIVCALQAEPEGGAVAEQLADAQRPSIPRLAVLRRQLSAFPQTGFGTPTFKSPSGPRTSPASDHRRTARDRGPRGPRGPCPFGTHSRQERASWAGAVGRAHENARPRAAGPRSEIGYGMTLSGVPGVIASYGGQRHCEVRCSGPARCESLRAAGRRCQQTRRGRHCHAERRSREGTYVHKMTHHGSACAPFGAELDRHRVGMREANPPMSPIPATERAAGNHGYRGRLGTLKRDES